MKKIILTISLLILTGGFILFHTMNKSGSGSVIASEENLEINKNVPDVAVKDLDGNDIEFRKLVTGKVTLLNFWATWCPPCRDEIPAFEGYYNKYKDKGLDIIAASVDKGPKEVKDFMKTTKMSFKVIMSSQELLSAYGGIRSIPTTFILDKDGQVKNKFVGFNPGIEKELKKYLEIE